MKLQIAIFFIAINFCVFSAIAQQKQRLISGIVSDSKSAEYLIGARVYDKISGKGNITDAHGHYSLWVSSQCDSVEIEVSYMGYISKNVIPPCDVNKLDWQLDASSYELSEVEVNAPRTKALDPKLSSFTLIKAELDALPSFAGEKDLLKYIQLTPGVQLTGDGNSNLYVRGGSSDQNLFLLDDMPLYHVSHLGNLTSTFNADIIKSAEVYLGSFPAEYGGRLSSVVDVRTIDGDLNKHHQSFTLGMLTSKILLDGPIAKGKAAYVASFRINTMPIFKWFWDLNVGFSMYDANLKLNYILSPKSRLYFSFYTGEDVMSYDISGTDNDFTTDISTLWGNTASSLRYNLILLPQLQLNFIAGYSKYHYEEKSLLNLNIVDKVPEDKYNSSFTSNIADNFLVAKTNFAINNNVRMQAGYTLFYHVYNPGHSIIHQSGKSLSTIDLYLGYPQSNAFEHDFFADITIDNLYGFGLYAGVRENLLNIENATFYDFQPRILVTRQITEELAFKLSCSRIWQPFHLLSNNSAGIPADYRIPAMDIAPPSTSNQVAFKISYIPTESNYEFSAETYLKKMNNLADMKEGVVYTLDYSNWEKILATNGTGTVKGVEVLLRKNRGHSTGWIGATLSNSTRQFNELNNAKVFPYKYDRLFSLSSFFQQQISKKISVSATWVFGTGLPYNLPRSQYEDIEGNYVLIYGEMNELRQKTYHRLDIGLSYKFQGRKSSNIIDFSVINVYNRRNPHLYRVESTDFGGVRLYEFSLFPILPSLSWSIKY